MAKAKEEATVKETASEEVKTEKKATKKAVKKVDNVEKSKKIVDRYFNVIIKPLVTEKTMKLTQEQNKVTVVVAKDASKELIKDAFEAIFGVEVAKVNTMNVRPKAKRMGRYEGQVSGYKKAIVTLKDGNSLDLFKENTAK